MARHIGFDQQFKPCIVFRGPFGVGIFGHCIHPLFPLFKPDLDQAADGLGVNSAEPGALETTEYPRLRVLEKILLTPHDRSQKDHPNRRCIFIINDLQ
jgi:hypothetical protein